MEKYSVLMSVYYKENPQYLKQSIDSMLNQTIKPDEFIIVKDGPLTDELDNAIDGYVKNYSDLFSIVSLKENKGLGIALREGTKISRNELIARMDSDDISLPTRCEKQLEIFNKNKELAVVGTNMTEFINEETNIISKRIVPEKDEEIKKYLKKRCPLNHVTVMYKKTKIINAGNYIEWHYNEDYYLWIRLYLNGENFYNIQENLVNVRVGKEMYRRRGGLKYFKSEKKIQDYMLKNKVIGVVTYTDNIIKRLIIQVLMPNSLRSIIFKKLARK